MTELWLIRHAESLSNARRLWQGQYDAPLSERGRQQAVQVAERLALTPPDVLYSSDLSRAYETASAIGEACGLSVQTDPRLREIDIGEWANRSSQEIAEKFPDAWQRMRAGDPHVQRGGGESAHQVQQRMVAVIDEIVAAHPEQRVAIVTHGFAFSTYLVHFLGMSLSHYSRLMPSNTALTCLQVLPDGQPRRMLGFNDTGHLA